MSTALVFVGMLIMSVMGATICRMAGRRLERPGRSRGDGRARSIAALLSVNAPWATASPQPLHPLSKLSPCASRSVSVMTQTPSTGPTPEAAPQGVVAGARCAGAATALLLARQGHDVLIVDR